MAEVDAADDAKADKSSLSSGFEDPLGVYRNEEESDEYDFDVSLPLK